MSVGNATADLRKTSFLEPTLNALADDCRVPLESELQSAGVRRGAKSDVSITRRELKCSTNND